MTKIANTAEIRWRVEALKPARDPPSQTDDAW